MPRKKPHTFLIAAFTVAFAFLITSAPALAASTEKVLYSFCSANNCTDGYFPIAGLIFDTAGNLYGTAYEGGVYGGGAVFELTPGSNGTWSQTLLYSFSGSKNGDGMSPYGGLVFDAAGNLYGATQFGGASGTGCNGYSCGTVFELTPNGGGKWTETVLYSFTGGTDGSLPSASLVLDQSGNLYGTTQGGGANNTGTVFQLTFGSNGKWTETVLHSFNPKVKDGFDPFSALIFDATGNLYGTTRRGGTAGYGTVFQLTLGPKGKWTEKLLHSFKHNAKDGENPWDGVILDVNGNLYGTTNMGGADSSGCKKHGCGAVFQLTPGANGKWTEKLLHSFSQNGKDGYEPQAGLILDAAGNLYGATQFGGAYHGSSCYFDGCGTVFQLTPGTNGKWTEKILHSFTAQGVDGYKPESSLVFDAVGNLCGTTQYGGAKFDGVVFEITP